MNITNTEVCDTSSTARNGKTWTVYVHTNLANGKRYVGITSKRPQQRWNNGDGYSGTYFYNAIQKYGWDGFSHEILFSGLSEEDAKSKEIELIAYYNTTDRDFGYNRTNGGDGSLGRIVSDETKRKIGDANRGRKHSDEIRHRISESLIGNKWALGYHHTEETKKFLSELHAGNHYSLGHHHTEESKRKISEALKGHSMPQHVKDMLSRINRGRQLSEDVRARISEANTGNSYRLGKKHTDESKQKMSDSKKRLFESDPSRAESLARINKKAVDMLSLEGVFIKTYESAKDAMAELGIDNSSIGKVCKGKMKSAGGYLWRFHIYSN